MDMAILQLLKDVETRWSSTYLMIDRAILLREAIEQFLYGSEFAESRKYSMNNEEWKALEVFHEILQVPHAFQQLLSSESTPTLISVLSAFEAMKLHWQEQQAKVSNAAGIIQQGLDKSEDHRDHNCSCNAYNLATVINPACKLEWFEQNTSPAEAAAAKNLFLAEMRKYKSKMAPSALAPAAAVIQTQQQKAYDILFKGKGKGPLTERSVEQEWYAYIAEPTDGFVDAITYWKASQTRFPTIYAIAMDILPIQASAVPCERVFSSGKITVTDRRNKISGELMEALQILKFRFKQGHSLSFTHGLDIGEELKDLESCAKESPEEISSYLASLK
ncbi:uncharacterized protein PHACADRAFT_189306 [Phanerochaete carnosa HHB-10118-sp]|uniref:HAT C-terminal dimerisation domain-containing protein n=1 Tax=Phanerochaete carnosa (strain HHB-10118-sp) TaxID=650164 RepID=K5WLW4_PHACS|nr:uncharacterized protein PHACADRAFT_189306 [Phanerochaete carnosa HHB-10118-sp]EKM60179.1 hypothetical protein PHACADRAFT_189306 [Phanerochaete carnosa HHB-10118-sp]